MHLSARVDYAIRAAVEMASQGEDARVTADALATAQGIPLKFLEGILTDLRRGGVVQARRGVEGGYTLGRPAGDVTLADIIRVIDGPLTQVRGVRPEDVRYAGAAEHLRQVWIALRANEREILDTVTIDDVARGRLPGRIRALAADPTAWV